MIKNHGIERVSDPAAARYYEAASNMGAGLLNTSFQDADDIAEAVAQPNRDMVAERRETEIQMQRETADGSGSIINATVRDAALRASLMETAAGKTGKKDKKGGIDFTTQLILLNQQIAELDAQIAEYEKQIADIENNVFTPMEMVAFDALPPEDRRSAIDQAMRDKVANGEMNQAEYDRWKRLQDKLNAAKTERETAFERRDEIAPKVAQNLEQASARGEASLNEAMAQFVQENSAEDNDATRAHIKNRTVLESMDRAQAGPDGSPETISRLTQFRDQKTDQKPDLMPTQSTLSLSGIPDLNAMPLSSAAAMNGGGRTTSVAGALDGDRRGPVITPEFTRVSAMKDLTSPDLREDIVLDKTGDFTGGTTPGSNFG
jgi:hypothetical protein